MLSNAILSAPGLVAIFTFVCAYVLVIFEEFTELRKSKPVLLGASIIWILVGIAAANNNQSEMATHAVKELIADYGELLLFLVVAMTYVNVMQERRIFEALRVWLVQKNLTFKQLFWITGILTFFISPLLDNLTTVLIMGAVIITVGKTNHRFIALSCINLVVAANAGGVYSPFGDITSLMVWQSQALDFAQFGYLFIPAAISYLIPALGMSMYVPHIKPVYQQEKIQLQYGATIILLLFGATIITAICFQVFLKLPAALGMMMGLSYLKFYSYYLRINNHKMYTDDQFGSIVTFDIMKKIERIEWDTLLFFYGIMLCIGGLATFGYLHYLAKFLYQDISFGFSAAQQATPGNIFLGLLSAIVDNIPVMYAVINMQQDFSAGQWLLVTLTTGIGGSILAIGSAAGVALLGQSKGHYTFFNHLKWTPAILLGYFAGVACHLVINDKLFY
jgi:Na+/H+ antiporter NhaD/arsenite permease-like protein